MFEGDPNDGPGKEGPSREPADLHSGRFPEFKEPVPKADPAPKASPGKENVPEKGPKKDSPDPKQGNGSNGYGGGEGNSGRNVAGNKDPKPGGPGNVAKPKVSGKDYVSKTCINDVNRLIDAATHIVFGERKIMEVNRPILLNQLYSMMTLAASKNLRSDSDYIKEKMAEVKRIKSLDKKISNSPKGPGKQGKGGKENDGRNDGGVH